jgi:oligopeptide/dipeptide ABC transporter ATP-binding protein
MSTTKSTEPPIIELARVSKVYRSRSSLMRYAYVQAVEDVSLRILPSTTTCIVGETGSGKSTLGRLLLGLTPPSAGQVRFRGHSVEGLKAESRREYRRSVQMVFQSPLGSFNPMLSIGASIRDALRYAPPSSDPDKHRETARLLDQVGLPATFAERFPDEVSGGELQRASIARALATDPSVIFLDEPASALDVSVRGQVFNLLMDLQRDRGLAYVLVTHELPSAEALADRVVVMYLGRIIEVAPKDAFFRRAAHPYSVGLIAAAEIEAEGSAQERPLVSGDVPSVTDPPPGCRFHPRCWLYEQLDRPARCRDTEPQLEQVEAVHSSACFYREEALAREVSDRPDGATVTPSHLGGMSAPRDREGVL